MKIYFVHFLHARFSNLLNILNSFKGLGSDLRGFRIPYFTEKLNFLPITWEVFIIKRECFWNYFNFDYQIIDVKVVSKTSMWLKRTRMRYIYMMNNCNLKNKCTLETFLRLKLEWMWLFLMRKVCFRIAPVLL